MSELTASLGTHVEFTWDGRTYNVSLVTQKIKAAFEKRQFSRARDAALILKTIMTAREYQAHLKELSQDYIHGYYGLESENGLTFAQTTNGAVLLCSLLFNIPEEEMLQLMLAARTEISHLLETVIAESFGVTPKEEQPAEEQPPVEQPVEEQPPKE